MKLVNYEMKTVNFVTKTSAAGKPYQVAVVEYRDEMGKLQERTIMPFGTQANTFKKLQNGIEGPVTVTMVKNDKGYNDWTDITAGGTAVATTAPQATAKGASPAPRNTYETPEERAIKQRYIVRQSSLTNAINLFELDKKRVPTVQDIIAVAKQFEDYVFGQVGTDEPDEFKDLAAMDDDVPL